MSMNNRLRSKDYLFEITYAYRNMIEREYVRGPKQHPCIEIQQVRIYNDV